MLNSEKLIKEINAECNRKGCISKCAPNCTGYILKCYISKGKRIYKWKTRWSLQLETNNNKNRRRNEFCRF